MRYGNVTGKEWNSVPFPGQGEVSKDGKKPADAKIKTSYVTSMGKKGKRWVQLLKFRKTDFPKSEADYSWVLDKDTKLILKHQLVPVRILLFVSLLFVLLFAYFPFAKTILRFCVFFPPI